MATARKFRISFASIPRQPGELARLKVVHGPDAGATFIVTGQQATIGRGDENDVVVADLKASRKHAVLAFAKGVWEICDAGSANGILHNGKPTPKAELRTRDTFSLGETTLEFFGSEAGTQTLGAPVPSGLQLQGQQAGQSVVSGGRRQAIPGITLPSSRDSKPKVLALFGLAALAAVFLLPDEEKPAPKAKPDAGRDLAAFLPPPTLNNSAPGANRTADAFFKMGFREFRTGNYLRARSQFETVLQLQPNHPLARIYMENCRKAIKEEIEFHLSQGKKDTDSGKIKQARGHFEAIIRLLHRDMANPAYIEARDNLKKLDDEERKAG